MSESGNNLLSLKNISKSFGGIHALNDVSFDIKKNEVLALLGDNGAGKSTLIKIISGAYQQDKGDIYLEGEKVRIKEPEDAKKLGIKTVYQDMALFGILDVTQNFFAGDEYTEFGFLNKKKMDEKSVEVLDKLNVQVKSLRQEVRSLSGGQQHAIAIGRCVYIGKKPKLVIMDEPATGLGVEESRKVVELIKELGKEITVIFITHTMDYAFEACERAIILHSGNVAGTVKLSEVTEDEIVAMMMGRIKV